MRRKEEVQGRGCTQAIAHLPPETPSWLTCAPALLRASLSGDPGVLLNPDGAMHSLAFFPALVFSCKLLSDGVVEALWG